MATHPPTSRRARLERMLGLGPNAPFTFAQVAERYRATYRSDPATHDDLTSAFGALIHAGAVERVGVTRGTTRRATSYVFVGPHSAKPNDELVELVVDIITGHYRQTQAPMPTAAVRETLRERGNWPDRFARLHSVLRVLSTSAPTESVRDDNARTSPDARGVPRLRRASGMTVSGIPSAFWLPGWAPDQCALAPANATEAVRRSIAVTSSLLRRPASKSEIISWLHTQPPTSPLRRVLPLARTSSILRNLRDREEDADLGEGRLHVVCGPITCHGGAPKRYSLRGPTPDEVAACRLLDALYAIRPARELTAIARLPKPKSSDRTLYVELARLRAAALRSAVVAYVGTNDPARLRETAAHTRARVQTTRGRAAGLATDTAADAAARHRRALPLDETMADIDAVLTIAGNARLADDHLARVSFVGRAGLVSVGEAHRYVVGAGSRGELHQSRPRLAYRNARRFPNARGDAKAQSSGGADVDVVDLLSETWSRATDPTRRAVVAAAHALIGDVLRDAAAFESLAGLLSPVDGPLRSAFGVASWMLRAFEHGVARAVIPGTAEARRGLRGATPQPGPIARQPRMSEP